MSPMFRLLYCLRNRVETWQPHSNAEFFVLFSPNAEPGARLIMYLKFLWLAWESALF